VDGAIANTRQIGSTPNASRWASMNSTITDVGVELGRDESRRERLSHES
jgi:hypothetical protein